MKPFVGYTRRPEPKWPYLLIFAVIVCIIFVLVIIGNLLVSFRYAETSKKVSTTLKPSSATSTLVSCVTSSSNAKTITTSSTLQNLPTTLVFDKKPGISGIKVEKIFFTGKVDSSNQPGDLVNKVSLGSLSRLYCYTKIISNPPQTIHHVWLSPDGGVAGKVTLYITNNPAFTWSYIGLGEPQVGFYKVNVTDNAGNILAEQSIELAR
ncbi:MAG: DUF2914 domain-containing protein [Candidatus Margulisiibacteriota bacterium]